MEFPYPGSKLTLFLNRILPNYYYSWLNENTKPEINELHSPFG